ncbi:MAG: hypothetical protein AAGA60_33075 [Cyanobacteria bacterium P01_E01_bin.42]
MSEQKSLIYPTLNLFLYDRRDGSKAREKLGDRFKERLQPPLYGHLSQTILADAYALHLNCCDSNDPRWQTEPKSINCLGGLKNNLLEQSQVAKGELGKTWAITGKLANEKQDAEQLAQKCYQKLALSSRCNWQTDAIGKGRIFEATIFEVWHRGDRESHHLFIVLFDAECKLNLSRIDRLLQGLLPLFLHRHRILATYQMSCEIKAKILQIYEGTRGKMNRLCDRVTLQNIDFNPIEGQLVQTLEQLDLYLQYLTALEEKKDAMIQGLKSYQDCRANLKTLAPDSDLCFLRRFKYFAIEHCLQAIQRDIRYLQPGIKLLENFIKTAEGVIKIEQTKNQDRLQKLVVATGCGVATTTALPPLPDRAGLSAENSTTAIAGWSNFLASFMMSLLLGLGVAVIAWHLFPERKV